MTDNQKFKKQYRTRFMDIRISRRDFKLIVINMFMKQTKIWEEEMKGSKISTKNWNLYKTH